MKKICTLLSTIKPYLSFLFFFVIRFDRRSCAVTTDISTCNKRIKKHMKSAWQTIELISSSCAWPRYVNSNCIASRTRNVFININFIGALRHINYIKPQAPPTSFAFVPSSTQQEKKGVGASNPWSSCVERKEEERGLKRKEGKEREQTLTHSSSATSIHASFFLTLPPRAVHRRESDLWLSSPKPSGLLGRLCLDTRSRFLKTSTGWYWVTYEQPRSQGLFPGLGTRLTYEWMGRISSEAFIVKHMWVVELQQTYPDYGLPLDFPSFLHTNFWLPA